MIKLEQLSTPDVPDQLPRLDRIALGFEKIPPNVTSGLSVSQRDWIRDGYLILRNLLPHHLIDEYCALRKRLKQPNGWKCPTPYMYYKEIRDLSLFPPLMGVLRSLIGDDMGLHLNLTGWVSTERAWHQDDYLNPSFINSWYAATWIALDDIDEDSGPFEFVPGSHTWPLTRKDKVFEHLEDHEKDASWPWHSERICVPAFEEYIQRTGSKVEKFIAKKGDVLIWHGRLAHRGSAPKIAGTPRKTLISHYSAVSKRKDMPLRGNWDEGATMFLHNNPLDPGSPASTV